MSTIIGIIWLHFLADFVFQTDEMAVNKSTSNLWLATHVLVYCGILIPYGWKFAVINAVAHFCTDWASSRLSSYYWKQNRRHAFFVVIGADQAIHLTTLILTVPIP
jgi:hypothetical protein